MTTAMPGDLGPNKKRIEKLLDWVSETKPGPALNLGETYNQRLTDDLQMVREKAEAAGRDGGRDIDTARRRAENAAWAAADQFHLTGPDRQHVVDAVQDAVLAVQIWDLEPALAERLYDPLGSYLNEHDLGT